MRVRTWATVLVLSLLPAFLAARTRTDDAGRRVEVVENPQRIVSLAPSLTETLFALGLGERVVGVTDYCDYPAEARSKTRVGGIINPSVEAIVSLAPDLVLITREGNRRETMEALERLGVPVFAVNTNELADVFRTIRHLGELAGVPERGRRLAADLERQSAAIAEAIRPYPARRVLFLVWLQPVVSVGRNSFIEGLLQRSGAESIAEASAQPWPHLSIEEILRSEPEFILIPRSSSFAPTRAQLLRLPGWRELKAVRAGRIVYLPASVERPGPRLIEVQDVIARAIHPEAFKPSDK
ncbi:MAG: cobalamin-binding protein [Acidobacteria bacterium]|nr:cobalamin-binding protein [Acidobacteriota bacterium]